MTNSTSNTPRSAIRGASVLALFSIIGPVAGIAGEKTSNSPPPKAAPAPAHPAAAPQAAHPGQAPQNNNGHPAPNGVTMGNNGHPAPNGVTMSNNGHPAPNGVTMNGNGHPAPNGVNMNNRPAPNTVAMNQPSLHGNRPVPAATAPHLPPGTHVGQGGVVYSANSHGALTHVYDPKTGMNVDHLPGHNRSVTERNGVRVVSDGHIGYSQHTYSFHGQQFAHRTYVDHGRTYDRVYSEYGWHGMRMEAYRPSHYYSPGFYRWAGARWAGPVHYGWGYQAAPWYAYYGPYFAPAPVYDGPSLWVTDYMISSNLQEAYAAQNGAPPPADYYGPPSAPAPLTPEVKQQIANEVQHQMQVENAEAQANTHGQLPGGAVGLAALFADNQPHVFIAGADLGLTDLNSGRDCQISQGDVLQVRSPPAPNSATVTATVLSSKGGADCASAANVNVNLSDLQEMQNHMRETADEGLRELQAKQGSNGLPAAPSDATAPPVTGAFVDAGGAPDPQAAGEITAQANAADQAQQSAGAGAGGTGVRAMNLTPAQGAPAAQSENTATITAGQSIATVVTNMGNPATILNLGAKQVYIYKNPGIRVTFVGGKVSDIE